jgi:hypothetical protein
MQQLESLIREVEEARLEEAVLAAAAEDLLDRARDVSHAVEQQVKQVTAGVSLGPVADAAAGRGQYMAG